MESPKSSCPWGQTAVTPQNISLADVMSEELAKNLQLEENSNYMEDVEKISKPECSPVSAHDNSSDEIDCESDEFLARVLQMELDREHDELISKKEHQLNGVSKISLSYEKYRCLPDGAFSSDDEEEEDLPPSKHWDSFEKDQKQSPNIGKSGIAKQGNVITTKHDLTVCGRRNACRVMEFPPGISTGDGAGFDMKLSNNVFNSLKVHSQQGEKRAQRLHDKKDKSTAEQVLDPKTRLILYKLVNNDILESINGCISTGKEAVIFHATGGQKNTQVVPSECAIKVFKTTLNEFKNRDKYIREDYRFRERFGKQNPRKVIHMWAEKEMHNLNRMRKAGISCPEVVILKKHILVMTFIGHDQKPAPKLKEVKLNTEQMSHAYSQTIEIMKRLYNQCRLVHADLSEYNLLWHNSQVWVIDVSQSVEPTHPHALEFLYRDCQNMSRFFSKQGLPDIPSAKELFTEISGLELPGEGAELLSEIQSYERNEEILAHGASQQADVFETLFSKCSQQSMKGSLTDNPSLNAETLTT